MPPVMGASAFLMAQILGIPYWSVAVAAAVPAILYYLAVFLMVDLEAARTGLKGLSRSELPNLWKMLRRGYLLAPLVVISYLLARGYTPAWAALSGVLSIAILSMFSRESRLTPRRTIAGLADAGRSATQVATIAASAGIIIALLNLSGLGLKFSSALIEMSGGNTMLLLILLMIATLILGMGMPTIGAYITVVSLIVPTLIMMGIKPLAAHMFAFYFACISAITPPVALAAYAAGGLAKANPFKVGFTACRLGLSAFIIPFTFVMSPELLLMGEPLNILLAFLTASIGVFALSAAAMGYLKRRLNILERILGFVAAIALIFPGITTDAIGLLFLGIMLASQFLFTRRGKSS